MPKKHQNDPRSAQKRPQDDQKSDPERQDEKRTETKQSWDRLRSPTDRLAQFARTPGAPFGRPNRHQNRSQNDQKSKRKIKRPKNRSKTILDPSWGDLGPSWGAILGTETPQTFMKQLVSWTITFSMLRRFEDGFGTNFGRPRRQNDRK